MKEEGLLSKSNSNDEIFTTLLKINNFDNSIKDESLDINLSACVTISTDPTSICNNSLSSDFWKVLDENAQAEESVSSSSNRTTTLENIDFISPLPPPQTNQQKIQNSEEASSVVVSTPKKKYRSRKQAKPIQSTTDNGKNSIIISDALSISNNFKGNFPSSSKSSDASIALGFKFKCEHCRVILEGLEEFTKHEATHKILFKCNECDREFSNESGLKKHAKSHREDSRKDSWRKCPDCGKCLKLGSMWMHRKIHSDNKKYGCDICGQKFVQKINLTHHSRVHTAEKPFECPECKKRFQERSHLQRHQKYHAQTRPFRCEKCGKMYKTERCLKVHNLVHLEQRPFACQVCNKSFISNSKLKQHSNIHTGERPFKCNYCTRDFTNFPNWLKHTRRRHKVDHKTGELLENIPSYCTKSGKKSTTAASTANDEGKPTRKRKKADGEKAKPKNDKNLTTTSQLPPPKSTSTPSTVQLMKAKVKVEVEKDNEINKLSNTQSFTDLHCLSITSAEELLIEQALEMEECNYYDPQFTNESVQFLIKDEFPDKKEFVHNKALCSVDSSPFSSPASIELPITYNLQSLPTTKISTSATITSAESTTAPRIYLPVFKSQSLPSVDTLLNACYFKSENQNM